MPSTAYLDPTDGGASDDVSLVGGIESLLDAAIQADDQTVSVVNYA